MPGEGTDTLLDEMLIEQYRQIAAEYRAEDTNTWQTFAVILAINGAMVSFLGHPLSPSVELWSAALVGVASSLGGILIISRTSVYQRYRCLLATRLEERTGLRLYSVPNIEKAIVQYEPTARLRWHEKVGGRRVMILILTFLAVGWLALASGVTLLQSR